MITLLSKIFIKNNTGYNKPEVRTAYGLLCSLVGIFLNILLFAGKYAAGIISSSVAITADAFNNLSDSASSFITLLGFKLAEQKPHADHPFGHGRYEYISGLIVSFLILLMGFEVGRSSVQKIIDPQETELTFLTVIILLVSVGIKFYMFFYNSSIGKKIDSSSMKATAYDSFGDMASTGVVLIASVISHFTAVNIDGWCGLLVAAFIVFSGIKSAIETINPLLGQPPSPEFVEQIESIVFSHPEIIGIHDLVVHDYGTGRRMVSLHGELPGYMNVMEMHDIIDCIEAELYAQLGCEAVIHMDPIDVDNPQLTDMSAYLNDILSDLYTGLSHHDLRMVPGNTHTNVIFDIIVPYGCKLSQQKITAEVRTKISEKYGENYFCVIRLESSYV
ncbi:MAG: cation transporter [Clostridia bacterium]|nr:cation transporter [Clostridia bacterium]